MAVSYFARSITTISNTGLKVLPLTIKQTNLDFNSTKLLKEAAQGGCPLLLGDVVTEEEEKSLLRYIDSATEANDISIRRFRARPYEVNHWDRAISGYKELQRPLLLWNDQCQSILSRIFNLLQHMCGAKVLNLELGMNGNSVAWLPPHIIDLHEQGEIFPHVDSIKHSGKIVAGLNLLSARTMVLSKLKQGKLDWTSEEDANVVCHMPLPPRSLYLLHNASRFELLHSIPKDANLCRRISIIFRDDNVSPPEAIKPPDNE